MVDADARGTGTQIVRIMTTQAPPPAPIQGGRRLGGHLIYILNSVIKPTNSSDGTSCAQDRNHDTACLAILAIVQQLTLVNIVMLCPICSLRDLKTLKTVSIKCPSIQKRHRIHTRKAEECMTCTMDTSWLSLA